MRDDQLSFETTLFDRERELLLLIGSLSGVLQSLYYERTKITATLNTTKSKRSVGALKFANTAATNALTWLSNLQYKLSKELFIISGMGEKSPTWYDERLNSDIFIEEAATTPYAIYHSYMTIYKHVNELFADHEDLISSITGGNTYVREFHVDMQAIGEEIEEII